MAERAPEFVAGLVDAARVSHDRLARALALAQPGALAWCDRSGSGVARPSLVTALIASLPQVLRLRWSEVLRRARRSSDLLARPSVAARFRPSVDVFDAGRPPLTVMLAVELDMASANVRSARDGEPCTVHLRLYVGEPGTGAAFHELARDLVLPVVA